MLIYFLKINYNSKEIIKTVLFILFKMDNYFNLFNRNSIKKKIFKFLIKMELFTLPEEKSESNASLKIS